MAYTPNFQYPGYYPGYPQTGAVPDALAQYKYPYLQPQPPAPAVASQPVQAPPQANGDIVWVQGEAAAKSYPVAPGSKVFLMDSERESFYIKMADTSGMPLPLRVFDYTERIGEKPPEMPKEHVCQCGEKYVKKDDFEALARELEEMRTRVDALTTGKKSGKE